MTPSQLTWSHFRKASWLGFLCLPVAAAAVGAVEAWLSKSGYPDSSGLPWWIQVASSLANALVWMMGSAFAGSIFLGIPALLFGLLRWPLMLLLFNFCRSYAPKTALALALIGTLAVFELPVWLIAGHGRGQAYGYSVGLFCFGVSLPWLVGSLWATWLLRKEMSAQA